MKALGISGETAARCRDAALDLHEFLSRHHVQPDGALVGPCFGTRFNLRVGRFLKAYLPFVPFRDGRYYVQGQAYWIAANLDMYRATGNPSCLDAALRCAQAVLARQTAHGHWILANPEWKGRIATVETCFGGLALLAAYRAGGDGRFLDGAKRAYAHLIEECGFLPYDEESACIRYFSNYPRGLVPNNATLANWFFADLSAAAADRSYLEHCPRQVRFLTKIQLESGELPYLLHTGATAGADRVHYLCYQYNAFESMDLMRYHELTGDSQILPVIHRLAGYLSGGLAPEGHARYDCFRVEPVVNYYTAAVSAALALAHSNRFGAYDQLARQGFDALLGRQNPDGGFGYSTGDYHILSDNRSYPRPLAMILRHLLIAAEEPER